MTKIIHVDNDLLLKGRRRKNLKERLKMNTGNNHINCSFTVPVCSYTYILGIVAL